MIFDATQVRDGRPGGGRVPHVRGHDRRLRYDDDACDGVAPDQQSWATVQAAHAGQTITGIYVTTGFAGGAPLAAILRTLKVNGEEFKFGV